MKKKYIWGILLALSVALTGCGDKEEAVDTGAVDATETAEITEEDTAKEAAPADENQVTSDSTDAGDDSYAEELINRRYDMDYSDGLVADLSELPRFSDFIRSQAVASFNIEDGFLLANASERYDLFKPHTLMEMISIVNDSFPDSNKNDDVTLNYYLTKFEDSGENALSIRVDFPNSPYEAFSMSLLVKDTGDKLEIGYYYESKPGSSDNFPIIAPVVVHTESTDSEVTGGDMGYFDSELKYHYLYSCYNYWNTEKYAAHLESKGITLPDADGLWHDMGFYEFYDITDPEEKIYTYYVDLYAGAKDEATIAAIYEDGSPYKEALAALGIDSYKKEDLNSLFGSRVPEELQEESRFLVITR